FDRLRYTIMFARRFQAFGYCLPNTVLCQPIVFALFLPLFIFPFRIEALTFREAGGLKNLTDFIKYFIKFRLLVVRRTFSSPDTIPLLSANTFAGPS
ncbi:MAG: hypothetical protein QGH32_09000, partial [Alphaproteobacteria bacterium]|nr:hypothetical protein [Alphaproteobacteria bacterium]